MIRQARNLSRRRSIWNGSDFPAVIAFVVLLVSLQTMRDWPLALASALATTRARLAAQSLGGAAARTAAAHLSGEMTGTRQLSRRRPKRPAPA